MNNDTRETETTNSNEEIKRNYESISSKIYEVRGVKVMLDFELAELYGYETKYFNRQVHNNIEKFDESFMFKLTKDEWDKILRCKIFTSSLNSEDNGDLILKSKILTSSIDVAEQENGILMLKNFTSSWGGRRRIPYAFTEEGIYMLMTILKGELATKQSIMLIKTFMEAIKKEEI